MGRWYARLRRGVQLQTGWSQKPDSEGVRQKGDEGVGLQGIQGKSVLGRRSGRCKGPGAGVGLGCSKNSKESSAAVPGVSRGE